MSVNNIENNNVGRGLLVAANNYGQAGGTALSGSFFQALSDKMEEWVKAMSDGKITQFEVDNINSMLLSGGSNPRVSASTAAPDETVLYDGSAASLYTSLQVSQISNMINFGFSVFGLETENRNKAASLLS